MQNLLCIHCLLWRKSKKISFITNQIQDMQIKYQIMCSREWNFAMCFHYAYWQLKRFAFRWEYFFFLAALLFTFEFLSASLKVFHIVMIGTTCDVWHSVREKKKILVWHLHSTPNENVNVQIGRKKQTAIDVNFPTRMQLD